MGVCIRFRTIVKICDVNRFNEKSKAFQAFVSELPYVGNVVPISHTEQAILDALYRPCIAFRLTIRLM